MRRKKKPLDLRPGNARGRRKLRRAVKRYLPWYKGGGVISGRWSSSSFVFSPADRTTLNYQYATKSHDVSNLFNTRGTSTGRFSPVEIVNTPKQAADIHDMFLAVYPQVRAWIEHMKWETW
jgi:hypothetical protein